MRHPKILYRTMFSTKGSSSYGKGIASNLVTEEQRQKYNSGGRVGLAYGSPWRDWDWQREPIRGYQDLDQRYATYDIPYQVEGSTGVVDTPMKLNEWGVPILPSDWKSKASPFWEEQKARQNLRKMKKAATPFVDEESEDAEAADIYQGSDPKYFARKFKKEDFGESDYEPIPGDFTDIEREETVRKHPLAWQYDTETLDETPIDEETFTEETLFGGKGPYTYKGEEGEEGEDDISSRILIDKLKPLPPRSNVDILKDKLAEDLAQAKTRGKVAAAAQGVKMASSLLTEPTWAKAIAKAGQQAPELVQAAYAPQAAAKKTERQFEMLEALQEQKGGQALTLQEAKDAGKLKQYEKLVEWNRESDISKDERAFNMWQIKEKTGMPIDRKFEALYLKNGNNSSTTIEAIKTFTPYEAVALDKTKKESKAKINKMLTKDHLGTFVVDKGNKVYVIGMKAGNVDLIETVASKLPWKKGETADWSTFVKE